MAEAGPFATYSVTVPQHWTDYNGHMHDASYVVALSDANEELFEALGLSADYRARTGASFYTVEYHVRYLAECLAGQVLTASTLLVEADVKRIRLVTELIRDGVVAAVGESLYLHVDGGSGRVSAMPDESFRRVASMLAAHREPGRPAG